MMQARKIGEVLVEAGFLSAENVRAILERQQRTGQVFGKLAEEMFNVAESTVVSCIAARLREQCRHVNLAHESIEPDAVAMLSPSQAWDHMVLPLRIDGEELVAATTPAGVDDAVATLQHAVDRPFRLVLVEARPLEQFIAETYGFEGVHLPETAAA
ncbi:MAG: hypothetical protein AAGB29_12280 [Planctomycetota bacterium]